MIRVEINPQYKALEKFIEELPMSFEHTGEVIYSGRNTIKTFEVNGLDVNVKLFKKPLVVNQIAYATIRKSKARRSYLYAQLLKEKGFYTPDPIAYMEQRVCGLLKHSLYICIHEHFDGMLRELQWGSFEERKELIRQFALYTANLHQEKILHLDYSSGNILYKKNKDQYAFYLVDLNRMKFNKPIDIDTACFNFRRLWGSDEMIEFFAREYAKVRNFDETKCVQKTFEYRKKFWDTYLKQYPEAKPYVC